MNTGTNVYDKPAETKDFLPLNGTDYVEFWVGNAKQAAYFYKSAFGFQSLAYSGPETGVKDRVSYVVQQDKIRFVLSTALYPDHEINEHYVKHGDGVRTVALMVEDATSAFEETVKRGAKPFLEPERLEDENGVLVRSGIHTYGDKVHLFIERKDYNGVFMPGFKAWETNFNPEPVGLMYIDHMVCNVYW